MIRIFLEIYALIGIVVATLSVILTLITGEPQHVFSDMGWLTLIVACGFISISGSIDKKK
ncbi:hypothetical protein ABE073_04960 [Lederbergia citrisecunda]|uniref:hypothetical protein n=1 Tax=Lederbergia citrisecunda TaxID=2833583 RepID=UPI003D2BACCB